MDYKLDDATTLTLGGRFTYEKRKLSDAAFAVTLVAGPTINLPVTAQKSVTAKEPTWRIALNHKFSPDIMGYVSYNRSEEHTSELQSLMRISYAVFCLKKKKSMMHNKNNN